MGRFASPAVLAPFANSLLQQVLATACKRTRFAPTARRTSRQRTNRMRSRTIVGSVAIAALACHDQSPAPLAPAQTARAAVIDPALSGALLTAATGVTLFVIVNYDPSKTTADALSQSLINGGAGVIQFAHLSMVAALATPAQVAAAGQLPGVQSVYLNRKLSWLLVHES